MKKSDFIRQAKSVIVNVNGALLEAKPRKFSTGSVGFYLSGKAQVVLPDGTIGKLQCGANLTVCGSKEWEEGEAVAA